MAISYDKKIMECVLRSVMSEGNVAQGKAIKSICKSPKPLFITGRAGTGKSFFIKRIVPALKNAVIVAPTGIAAVNAGGQTIHSFFRIGMQPYIPEIRKGKFMDNCENKFRGESEKILQNIKYLIIDEISMVRPDLLDNVADILRRARGDKDPFGGVKLIMVGDLFQLPPVIKEDFFREIYDTSYFFSSKSLMASGMEMVSFEKIYRQKDEKFISVLNKVRDGQMDDDVFTTLNSRCIQPENGAGYVEIVTTNAKATAINEMRINSVPGSLRKFEAIIKGDYPKEAPVEKTLLIKEGSRVMITRNGGEYVNGSLGVVSSIKNGEIEVVLDRPKDEDHVKVIITPCSFDKVKYVRNGYKVESEVIGSIVQYPIKAGYSITVHRCQGLTLDSAMMDVSNSFETGQLYTALSRVKSLDGMYLRQPIPKTVKTSDPVVIDFYNKTLSNEGIVEPIPMEELEKSMINLSTGSEIDFAEFNL
ncbi:MAG: PIF1-like helicase [Bacteriophage sp.]|nr:MAG: PIF1-like helicase [Bacteriophage sp.]